MDYDREVVAGQSQQHKQALLGVLFDYAPDGPAQEQCVKMVWQAEADHAKTEEITAMLAGALLNGIRHGNWPWTDFTKVNQYKKVTTGQDKTSEEAIPS